MPLRPAPKYRHYRFISRNSLRFKFSNFLDVAFILSVAPQTTDEVQSSSLLGIIDFSNIFDNKMVILFFSGLQNNISSLFPISETKEGVQLPEWRRSKEPQTLPAAGEWVREGENPPRGPCVPGVNAESGRASQRVIAHKTTQANYVSIAFDP